MRTECEQPTAAARSLQGLVVAWFLLSTVAAIGLAVVYAFGGQPQLEGVLLAVALGGIAIGLALFAHHFLPSGEAEEPRHDLRSTDEERQAFATTFERGEHQLTRRWLLLTAFGGALTALGAAALFPIRSLGPSPQPALRTTAWHPGARLVDENGRPIRPNDLAVDGVATVYPEGNQSPGDSQTVLIRLQPGELRPRPGREDWAPNGFVAYSKVCTHAGCPVGLYQASTHQLVCPCHQSLFDVTDGARPVFGPATRSLPQLPIDLGADGYFRARSDFTEPVGPGYWNR
jgi:ubiquinol-cytochrome c reductase iron-sulfur subunit